MNNVIYLNCKICSKRIVNKKEDLQNSEIADGFCHDCIDVADDLMCESGPLVEFEQMILNEEV
jgi:hypothetical protein